MRKLTDDDFRADSRYPETGLTDVGNYKKSLNTIVPKWRFPEKPKKITILQKIMMFFDLHKDKSKDLALFKRWRDEDKAQ